MGFRFRRRARILPGVYLNLSKSGVSASIGGHGATLNISKRGRQVTLGMPGTGLSYRSPVKPWASRLGPAPPVPASFQVWRAPQPQAPPRAVQLPAEPLALHEDDLPPLELTTRAPRKRSRGIGFLMVVFIAIGGLGLTGMNALDAAMKARFPAQPAAPSVHVHKGHDGWP